MKNKPLKRHMQAFCVCLLLLFSILLRGEDITAQQNTHTLNATLSEELKNDINIGDNLKLRDMLTFVQMSETDSKTKAESETESEVVEAEATEIEKTETEEQETESESENETETSSETSSKVPKNESNNISSYTYTSVSGTMYAIADLNVRSGPSVDYEIIDSVIRGDTVIVLAQCNETGWYRIYLNGKIGYCSNNYLTSTKPSSTSSGSSISDSPNKNKFSNEKVTFGDMEIVEIPQNTDTTGICGTDGTVSSSVVNLVNSELAILPDNIIENFVQSGWKVLVTDKDLFEEWYKLDNPGTAEKQSIYGATVYKEKTIYIEDCCLYETIGKCFTPIIHEIWHWIDYMYATDGVELSETDELVTLYNAEKSYYYKVYGSDTVSDCAEFYAECFRRYWTDIEQFETTCPKVKAYFDELMKNYN